MKSQIVKVDGYAHDELGITTEDPKITSTMNDKRLLKGISLAKELENYETVKVYGNGKTALLCWGSNKGVCKEAAGKFGLEVIHVLVLSPFPEKQLREALKGVDRIIVVECNSTGQLARLARCYGFQLKEKILKYDGRPFSLDDLEAEIRKVAA
jgi:2-oxoglutarate ferredoxin oxidoreductase subunit alpha